MVFQADSFQPDSFQTGTEAPAPPIVRRPVNIPKWWNRCYAANRPNGNLWGFNPCPNELR